MLPRILIRSFTGDHLDPKQNALNVGPESQDFLDIIGIFHNSNDTSFDESQLANTLDRDEIKIIPLNGESIHLNKLELSKRKEALKQLSPNPVVTNLLFKYLETGTSGDPISLDRYLNDKDKGLGAGNSSLNNSYTIQQFADGSLTVVKTTTRTILDSGNGTIILPDHLKFYTTTVSLRFSPLTETSESQAITKVERVIELVNFGVLEDQKNEIIKNIKQERKIKKVFTKDKEEDLYIDARDTLKAYTTEKNFVAPIDDIKKLFNVFGFDENAFASALIVLATMEQIEIEEIFSQNFTSLQLIKIYKKLDELKNEKNKTIVEKIQLSISNILKDKDHRVQGPKEAIPSGQGLEPNSLEEINFYTRIDKIKKEISSLEFFGSYRVKESSKLISLIDPLVELGKKLEQNNVKWHPIIKNMFSTYTCFSTMELCEINKNICRSLKDKDSNKTYLTLVSNLIKEILKERGIQLSYYADPDIVNHVKGIRSALNSNFKFFGNNTKKLIMHCSELDSILKEENKVEVKEVLKECGIDIEKLSRALSPPIAKTKGINFYYLLEEMKFDATKIVAEPHPQPQESPGISFNS